MKTIEIITTGNEIMSGLTVDTNFSWAADHVNRYGMEVKYHTSIKDDTDDIKAALKNASGRSEIIIFTGGLGPTEDDLTSETAADFFGVPVVFNEQCYQDIGEKLKQRGRKLLDVHKKQAMFPEGSTLIANEVGTSAGFKYVSGNSSYYFLPGVPREFKSMVTGFILPDIFGAAGPVVTLYERVIKTIGLGESEVATLIKGIELGNAELSYRIYYPEIHLKIKVSEKSESTALKTLDGITDLLKDKLGEYIFTTEGEELEEVVSTLLKENSLTLSTAESCTGGMLASRITDIPGSSEYFLRGVVSYSNKSKSDLLGVPEQLLIDQGAVSSQVVEAMALGIQEMSSTDLGIGISGIAGPGGGTNEKPVGTVYIGLAFKDDPVETEKFLFNGTRKEIKLSSTEFAMDMIRKENFK